MFIFSSAGINKFIREIVHMKNVHRKQADCQDRQKVLKFLIARISKKFLAAKISDIWLIFGTEPLNFEVSIA